MAMAHSAHLINPFSPSPGHPCTQDPTSCHHIHWNHSSYFPSLDSFPSIASLCTRSNFLYHHPKQPTLSSLTPSTGFLPPWTQCISPPSQYSNIILSYHMLKPLKFTVTTSVWEFLGTILRCLPSLAQLSKTHSFELRGHSQTKSLLGFVISLSILAVLCPMVSGLPVNIDPGIN